MKNSFCIDKFILLIVVVGLNSITIGSSGCHKSSLSKPLRIGMIKNELAQFPLVVMERKNFLTSEGFTTIHWRKYSSTTALMNGFERDEYDIGGGNIYPVTQAIVEGRVDVSIFSPISLNGYCLLVRAQDRIDDLSGLRGKKIGLQSRPGIEEFLLLLAFSDHGLGNIDLKTEIFPSGDMERALLQADVDGIFVTEPESSRLLLNKQISLFLLSEKIWPDHPHAVLFVSNQFLLKRPDVVVPIISAQYEMMDWLQRNKAIHFALATRYFSLNPEVLKTALGRFNFTTNTSFHGWQQFVRYTQEESKATTRDRKKFSDIFKSEAMLKARREFIARKQLHHSSLKK